MAQKYDRRRYGYTDGSLAYDLDALARERALEEAGRVEEDRREPAAAPRRQPVARPVAKLSPLVLACAALLAGLVVVLLMGYVRLTEVTADITQLKREMSQQEERHVALLTQYEKTFDLASIKEAAEAAGMSKPSASQIYYVDLSAPDSVVVYQQSGTNVLSRIFTSLGHGVCSVVEYFR